MNAHTHKHDLRSGATLVEVAVSLLIFVIVALGSAHYRYVTAMGVQYAEAQLTGADLAVTLLGAWQGAGGSGSYRPDNQYSSYLAISPATGDPTPDGYELLGAYDVLIGNRTYRSTLYWKDIESDLRELGVAVSWPFGGGKQQKTFELTGYVRM